MPSYRAARKLRWSDSVVQAALLTAGFFGALGVAAGLLRSQGILAEAWYWTFANHDLPHIFWSRGLVHTLFFVGSCLPLVIGAALGLTDRAPWRERRPEWLALAGLLAVSAVGAAAGGRFYPHYYQQLTPPLALLAAPVFARAWRGGGPRVLSPAVAVPWLAVAAAVFLVVHWRGLSPQREGTEVGRLLRAQAATGDRLFVWGQAPRIYLDARLRPASRYIATFPLTGFIFGPPLPGVDTSNRIVPGSWDNLRKDLGAHPPAFIVDAEAGPGARYPVERFPELAALLAARYRPIARTAEGVIYRRTSS